MSVVFEQDLPGDFNGTPNPCLTLFLENKI